VATVRGAGATLRRLAVTAAYLGAWALPRHADQHASAEDAARAALRYFGADLMRSVPPCHPDDLTASRLYDQVTVGGFHDLKPVAGDDPALHELDLDFLGAYELKPGCARAGGRAVVSFRERRVVRLVAPDGRVVTPDGDPDAFAVAAFEFRSHLFQWLTIGPHSAWCHGVVGPKLFLATHGLPAGHALRTLLVPFVFDVHRNLLRAKMTVFNDTGVLCVVGSFTSAAVRRMIADCRATMPVKLIHELAMPDDVRGVMEPLWFSIRKLVEEFTARMGVDEAADPHVRRFKAFLAEHVNARLGRVSLVDALTYALFTNSASHHA